MKTLLIYNKPKINTNLSYLSGWVKYFEKSDLFSIIHFNLSELFPYQGKFPLSSKIPKINFKYINDLFFQKFDCIIILHSAFSNACLIPIYLQKILSQKKCIKVYFIGNEYKHMPQKINFINTVGITHLISQTDSFDTINLYKKNLSCNVESIPSGGLDPEIFYPKDPKQKTDYDIGFRAGEEPYYFGHQERRKLMHLAEKIATKAGLKINFSMDEKDRLELEDWADFLRSCKSIISTNTGYEYFSLNDDLRLSVLDYINKNNSNFDEIFTKFFLNRSNKSIWRSISGRNIEAAGCKTLQVLVKGDYNNYFQPNLHYIPINPDLSNLQSALEKIEDKNHCSKIIENAFELVNKKLTFKHNIEKLYKYIN